MNDISTERAGRSVSLTWYGQAGFRLAAGDSRVLIDPFLTGRPDRRYEPPATAADFADVTLVLCTHEHVDHLDLPFLRAIEVQKKKEHAVKLANQLFDFDRTYSARAE